MTILSGTNTDSIHTIVSLAGYKCIHCRLFGLNMFSPPEVTHKDEFSEGYGKIWTEDSQKQNHPIVQCCFMAIQWSFDCDFWWMCFLLLWLIRSGHFTGCMLMRNPDVAILPDGQIPSMLNTVGRTWKYQPFAKVSGQCSWWWGMSSYDWVSFFSIINLLTMLLSG